MSAAATKQVHGKGRLVSPVLVFASPPKGNKKTDYGDYQVYFRTAAGFAGPGHETGTIRVDDAISYGSDDLSHAGGGKPSGRCYRWAVVTTRKLSPKLTKKEAGDNVTVRLHAYHTALQVRKVKMLGWYPEGGYAAAKKAVAKIGCRL
jgi:hypothetical protein